MFLTRIALCKLPAPENPLRFLLPMPHDYSLDFRVFNALLCQEYGHTNNSFHTVLRTQM